MTDEKRTIYSWALYDWANSAFAASVMTVFFPTFFKKFWSVGTEATESTFYLGMANSVASILIAALAPFLGSIADRGSAKRKFLFTFAALGIVMTGALWMVSEGNWPAAIFLYIFASVGFAGGNVFYDSLLPGVASKDKVDYVSSLGFSLGYIGGGLVLVLNVLMYNFPTFFGIPDATTAVKLAFLFVAIWWALFTIPTILWVKEPKIHDSVGMVKAVSLGWKQFRHTLKDIRHLKVVGLFLLAYWFYIDGVDTIVKMSVDFGMSLGFPDNSLIIAILMVQFIAFPATMIYYKLSTKTGIKAAIYIGIIGYGMITFLGFFMQQVWHFYVLAGLVGLFQGGIQALSRSLYSRIIPKEKSAEFYGFYNMLGKFAAVLGPALLGTVTLITSNVRYGILSILILFIFGAYFLGKIDIEEGERIAKEYLAK
jgi:UMF1 family MFS transporter